MYTQLDLDQINAQEQKRWRLLVIPEVLLLAALVYSLVIRVEWLTTALTCVMAFLFIFCYGIAIKPLRCYAKHLQNARTHPRNGRHVQASGHGGIHGGRRGLSRHDCLRRQPQG